MAMAVSGGGVDGLISRSGEAAWAGDLAPVADGESEEGLTFRIFGVEGEENEAEDILHKARTGVRHGAAAMGCNRGPGAARASVRTCGCKGACGARVGLRYVV